MKKQPINVENEIRKVSFLLRVMIEGRIRLLDNPTRIYSDEFYLNLFENKLSPPFGLYFLMDVSGVLYPLDDKTEDFLLALVQHVESIDEIYKENLFLNSMVSLQIISSAVPMIEQSDNYLKEMRGYVLSLVTPY